MMPPETVFSLGIIHDAPLLSSPTPPAAASIVPRHIKLACRVPAVVPTAPHDRPHNSNIRGGGNSRDRQWTATFGSGNQWSPACPPVESAGVHWGAIVPVAPDRSPVELAGVQSMQTQ
ncbi:hypothetical protein B0H17DRAFT_1136187 [Mycena rosella]|uniref:Uncharacterized protein n=1 Tax=Mycena rosella TaxID=1033263 RepID=A0AAD7DBC1_MYCRO|nr:hypothetical protein B0H17DRAFT_1136187 [Mycena rosella]